MKALQLIQRERLFFPLCQTAASFVAATLKTSGQSQAQRFPRAH